MFTLPCFRIQLVIQQIFEINLLITIKHITKQRNFCPALLGYKETAPTPTCEVTALTTPLMEIVPAEGISCMLSLCSVQFCLKRSHPGISITPVLAWGRRMALIKETSVYTILCNLVKLQQTDGKKKTHRNI